MKKYLALLLMVLCLSDVRAYADTHTHKICGKSGLCDDNHPSHSVVEWVEWDGISELVYTNDEAFVALSANAERSNTLYINSGKTLNLCLNGHSLSGKLNGEAIRVWEGGILNICDCSLGKTGIITHLSGYLGTGIYNDGETSLYDITISGNTAEEYGGGITNRETMHIYGGRISDNTGGNGAIFNWAKYKGSNSPTHAIMKVYGATITRNIGTGFGGGIDNSGNLEIYDSYITNNTAEADGAGINSGDNTILFVDNCEIMGNVSQQSGGGIRNGGDAQIVSSSICRNEAVSGSSGGISSYKTMKIDSCTISENKKGGIWSGADLIVANSVISKNTDALDGGGIHCYGNLTIENSIIEYNSSRYDGGGISNTGGIYSQAQVILNDVIIRGNSARNGGGIYSNCIVTLGAGTEITDNEATDYGGGIVNAVWSGEDNITLGGNIVIDGAVIKSNSANCGGGVYNGTPYGSNGVLSTLEIKDGSIIENTAFTAGGIYQKGTMKIWGASKVIDNYNENGEASNVLNSPVDTSVLFGDVYTGSIGFSGGSRKRPILIAEGENYSLSANDVNRMSSDDPLYCIVYDSDECKGYLTYNPTPTPTPPLSPDGRFEFNGNYYKVFVGDYSWDEAKALCEELGGYLATITSAEEQAFVERINTNEESLWLGGYRDSKHNWYWVTGEAISYTNWGRGEPNNGSDGMGDYDPEGEDCLCLFPREWNDTRRDDEIGFVCEWGKLSTATPAPTTHPEAMVEFEGNHYKIVYGKYTWDKAKRLCEEMGGHLATITSPREQAFISLFNSSHVGLWIGGYRDTQQSWRWVTDEKWDYTHWIEGNPNDDVNTYSDEYGIATDSDGWYVLDKAEWMGQSGFICEFDKKVIPTPSPTITPAPEKFHTRQEIINYYKIFTYRLNDTGNPVVFIQTALRQLGYYQGTINGKFGKATEEAVKAFQIQQGLKPDGECDYETMVKLMDAFLESPTEDGDIIEDLDDLPNKPITKPILILSADSQQILGEVELKFSQEDENKGNTITYNICLVGADGNEVKLPSESKLIFPYPKGMDMNSKNKYSIIIHHYGSDRTEVFSSKDGTIEFLPQGLCIRVSSLSPFVLEWEEVKEVDLPQTGDNSHIALWLALLTMAGTSMLILKRKTA